MAAGDANLLRRHVDTDDKAIKGARILDLGCGAGRDVYALSQMVGPEGFVVGVDMTPEQIGVARSH
ncbi:MAG: methyltransferase domain-containing protein, partial [Pseudomonadota bacterium]